MSLVIFCFTCHPAHRDLHSFPTRRSSDLPVTIEDVGTEPYFLRHRQAIEAGLRGALGLPILDGGDRKSTRLNSSHMSISYVVFCLKKKKAYGKSTCAESWPMRRSFSSGGF